MLTDGQRAQQERIQRERERERAWKRDLAEKTQPAEMDAVLRGRR